MNTKRFITNTKVLYIIFLMFLIFGIFYTYKCFIIGHYIFFICIFMLYEMSRNAYNIMHSITTNMGAYIKQTILFTLFICFLFIFIYYIISIENIRPNVQWEATYFEYGGLNSKKNYCNCWHNGQHGDLPLNKKGTIGFGFRDNKENPIMFKKSEEKFLIKYKLSKGLLIVATFETINDSNLTEPQIHILPPTDTGIIVFNMDEFKWLSDNKDIKQLKINYSQVPLLDMIFIKILKFFDLNNVIDGYYLVP
ncbi:membrane protein [Candidatus Magnetomorum sp. HK-1]|nr:membrane protein [Candidatus Magnetomorum sp. HK-1]